MSLGTICFITESASSKKHFTRTGEIAETHAKRDDRIRYYRSEKNMGADRNIRRLYELRGAPR
jgi:hypothetical protein